MMRLLYSTILVFYFLNISFAQEVCNALGVWLWHIEYSGYSHEQLADKLAQLNVKRIYVKVADGRVNTTKWPELLDKSLVATYNQKGLEVWAWSYNYPNNDSLQALALTLAAQTGYAGYVVDVEKEFDGDVIKIQSLFNAFHLAKSNAIQDGSCSPQFKIYCTTWGNPMDHHYRIDKINPYVDGFMPQTYLEEWGSSYVANPRKYVNDGTLEYKMLGATKPIHHIVSTSMEELNPDQINEFIEASGPESSLWRIPGTGVPLSIWDDWADVNWDLDFCALNINLLANAELKILPNVVSAFFKFNQEIKQFELYDTNGNLIESVNAIDPIEEYDLSHLHSGYYFILLNRSRKIFKIVKI